MIETRRGLGRVVTKLVAAGAAAAMGAALGGCSFDPPTRFFGRRTVVRLAVFQSPYTTAIEPGVLAAQKFAAASGAQGHGYEVRIDQYSYTPTPSPVPADYTFSSEALEQANANGTPPDVVLLTLAVELPLLLKRRLVTPLGDMLKAARTKSEGYAPGALEAASMRGQLAALPLSGVVNLLAYDAALFREAAVDPPGLHGAWTWGDFLEACRRLTREAGADGRAQWGTAAHEDASLLQSLIWAHGGDVLAKNGRHAALGEPGARQGIQYWLDLMRRHRVAPVPSPPQYLEYGPTELWLTPQRSDGRTTAVGAGIGAPGTPRVATAVLPAYAVTPMVRSGSFRGPRTTQMAAVPVGARGTGSSEAQRVAQFYVLGALALGAKPRDAQIALRATIALADHLHQGPVNYGFPVRNVDAALVRRVQPLVSEQDAEVIASATASSRGVPLEATQVVSTALRSHLMSGLLNGGASLDTAIGDASAFIEEGLRV